MYKVGDTVYDYFTQENVKILEENTTTIPSIFTVEDESGKQYFLTEDDMAPEQEIF